MIVIDFETRPITPRDPYPMPVGVALKINDKPGYYVRGPLKQLREAVMKATRFAESKAPIVMHNGVGFDLGVAAKHLDLRFDIERVHDTLVLAFLDDPYRRLGLKSLAEQILGMPPDEQNDLKRWILDNVPEATLKTWGAYIYLAPPELVEPYAIGDVERTAALFKRGVKAVKASGMWEAYRREIEATPVLLDNELRGVHVDAAKLMQDAFTYSERLELVDAWIRRRLGSKLLEIDADQQLGAAIERKLRLTLPRTKTGLLQTSKDVLATLPDDKLRCMLLYRSALAQNLRTFLLPWNEVSKANNGRIFTHWNLVGGTGARGGGTKTGRLSSEPNFQNIPSVERVDDLLAKLGKPFTAGIDWALPRMRSYIVPPHKDAVIIGRDYSQQELRLLAEFERSDIFDLYKRFPETDVHRFVGDMIKSVTGVELPRKTIKVLNFCTIYGGGAPAIAEQGDMTLAEATRARELYFNALPSVRDVMQATQAEGRNGGIRTIGGRIYEAQQGFVDGKHRDFSYRLLNYKIQGSAADQMKECLRQISRSASLRERFSLTVHDEIVGWSEKDKARGALRELDGIMIGTTKTFKLHVPFLTEGYMGPNWADVKKEKGL